MEQVGKFQIVGISAIASGEESNDASRNLWERFYSDHIANQISNKRNNDIYSIYTDYGIDGPHSFTLFIGHLVTSLEDIRPPLEVREFEGGKYESFKVTGKMPDALIETWRKVNDDKNLIRDYDADFAIYENTYVPGLHSDVELFVSVK